MIIRNENEKDWREVEKLTRAAFWNVNVPGCNEHYLVHVMRDHPDYIPQLSFVAEENGKIIGNIQYTKAWLIDEDGLRKEILAFGPLSVHPDWQRKGIGKTLINHSFKKAKEMGYDTVVIFGNPENYVTSGFKNCKKFNISFYDSYPVSLLVRELREGVLQSKKWTYEESMAFEINEAEAQAFDSNFEPLVKEYRPSQELFSIYSRSCVVR